MNQMHLIVIVFDQFWLHFTEKRSMSVCLFYFLAVKVCAYDTIKLLILPFWLNLLTYT